MISPSIEEVLERLYAVEVEREQRPEETGGKAAFEEAASRGLVERRGDKYLLTAEGREAGRDVIRRHRLAERLLMDVLAAGGDHIEEEACRFEHILLDGLDERICVLLGHPATCPHGKPIPRGACCGQARADRIREVSSLCDGRPGATGQVAYLATRENREVQKLMAMGILPGVTIELIRCFPSYVFQVGYSQFTVDRALAEQIYVHWSAAART